MVACEKTFQFRLCKHEGLGFGFSGGAHKKLYYSHETDRNNVPMTTAFSRIFVQFDTGFL